jgi:hypothetical protein
MTTATMRIRSKSNAAAFSSGLTSWAKQLQFASAVALTRTAYKARDLAYDEFRRALDRPTRFTMNSLFVESATRSKREATVKTKPGFNSVPAGAWLVPNVEGGKRTSKSFERKVGSYMVPSKYMNLDSFGNVPGSTFRKIFSNLQLGDEQQSTNSAASKRKRKNEAYFLRNDIIFRRTNHTVGDKTLGAIIPQLILVKNDPDYDPVIRWAEIAELAYDRHYADEFDKAFDQAMATAR